MHRLILSIMIISIFALSSCAKQEEPKVEVKPTKTRIVGVIYSEKGSVELHAVQDQETQRWIYVTIPANNVTWDENVQQGNSAMNEEQYNIVAEASKFENIEARKQAKDDLATQWLEQQVRKAVKEALEKDKQAIPK